VTFDLGWALDKAGEPEEALAVHLRALALDPEGALAHHGMGTALLSQGSPEDAVAAHNRAIALDRNDHPAWNHTAILWAQAGDLAGYQGHCRRMLERFGGTTDPKVAERTAKACLLLALGGPELEAACQLADRAVTMAPGHSVQPWAEATRALAAYRRERFVDALAWADRCLSRGPGDSIRELSAHLVRAMALLRLGRDDEAGAAMATASDLYRMKVAKPGGRAEGGDWHDQVICEVLRREAEADFLDRHFPADPFAR
jgi:serine/threonine-protein kinase